MKFIPDLRVFLLSATGSLLQGSGRSCPSHNGEESIGCRTGAVHAVSLGVLEKILWFLVF